MYTCIKTRTKQLVVLGTVTLSELRVSGKYIKFHLFFSLSFKLNSAICFNTGVVVFI